MVLARGYVMTRYRLALVVFENTLTTSLNQFVINKLIKKTML